MSVQMSKRRPTKLSKPSFAAVSYAVGVLGSTASTYVLFVCFSLKSAPEHLGLFALWAGVAAVILQFVDGVSSQRISQVYSSLSGLCEMRPGSVNFLNMGRFATVALFSVVFAWPILFVDKSLAIGVGVMILGQGAYSLCVSTRVFGSTSGSLLRLQLFNCLIFCIASAVVFIVASQITTAALLVVNGLASLCSALPFLIRDALDRASMRLSPREEFRLMYSSDSWRHLGSLTAYQAVNACGTAVDTFLTAIGGLRTAAEYQVVKRPMMALSSLNVALGQFAINQYSRGVTTDWKRSLLVVSPVLVAWPLFGYAGLLVVRLITPADYEVSVLGGCLLAFSFALGAFLQITGTAVLVRMKTSALFYASTTRIVVLVTIALFAVPLLGVVGLALSIVAANAASLTFHILVLKSTDKAAMNHVDELPV